MITIDLESRSPVDLQKCGAWVYSQHKFTDIICLCYTLNVHDTPKTWIPIWVCKEVFHGYIKDHSSGFIIDSNPDITPHISDELNDCHISDTCPPDLTAAIESGELIEAHNVFFEYSMWENVILKKHNAPKIQEHQWRCSAAKAAYYSLPRALGDACDALDLPERKDSDGHKIMLRLCKPRKALKAEANQLLTIGCEKRNNHKKDYAWIYPNNNGVFHIWDQDPEKYTINIKYCQQDVIAERGLSQALPELSKDEIAIWQLDQKINKKGILIDRELCEIAQKTANEIKTKNDIRLSVITNEEVETVGQRDKLIDWLKDNCSVTIANLQKETVEKEIKRLKDLLDENNNEMLYPEKVALEVLQLRQMGSMASINKYTAMLNMACKETDTVKSSLLHRGANTGRWAGKGIQPQNFIRGKMKDPDTMIKAIKMQDHELLDILYGEGPITILSWATRGAIMAHPNYTMYVPDYSGVEARGCAWFVDDQDALDVFEQGLDIYIVMAATIYNKNYADVTDDERFFGKQAILGLGYGMGWKLFMETCARYGMVITAKFAKYVVETFRHKFWKIAGQPRQNNGAWQLLEQAAIQALENQGTLVPCFKVSFLYTPGKYLECILPSGRSSYYHKPFMKSKKTPWGTIKPTLHFYAVHGKTKKWVVHDIWGGTWLENIIQAICCDIMAEAMLRIYAHGKYEIFATIHDEILTEAKNGTGASVKELEDLMSVVPAWATGFPIAAEGWSGNRYKKN